MEDCGYAVDSGDCFRTHQSAHADIASWANEIRRNHAAGQPIQPAALEFFRDWMDAHVAGEEQDADLGTYFGRE